MCCICNATNVFVTTCTCTWCVLCVMQVTSGYTNGYPEPGQGNEYAEPLSLKTNRSGFDREDLDSPCTETVNGVRI